VQPAVATLLAEAAGEGSPEAAGAGAGEAAGVGPAKEAGEGPPGKAGGPPLEEVLAAVLRNLLAFLSEERTQAIMKIVLAEGPRNPALLEIWFEQVSTVVTPLLPYLMHEMEAGRIRPADPRLFVLALQGPLLATVIVRDLFKLPMFQDLSNDALVETLLTTTLKGFLTEKP
jgi:hypothetical protein